LYEIRFGGQRHLHTGRSGADPEHLSGTGPATREKGHEPPAAFAGAGAIKKLSQQLKPLSLRNAEAKGADTSGLFRQLKKDLFKPHNIIVETTCFFF
jgi:hypothetical protein